MPDWSSEIRTRLAPLTLSPTREAEIIEELSQHLDDRYGELLNQGVSEADAERIALQDFRSATGLARGLAPRNQQAAPLTGTGGLMHRITQDFRHAIRACRRTPVTSAMAIAAFALGIGITTGMFSVFYHVLLKPLPFPSAERLVVVYDTLPFCLKCPASLQNYTDWRARAKSFSAIGGSQPSTFVVTGNGSALQLPAVRATASLVNVFGVAPLHGRWFSQSEDTPGGAKVAVLSHATWTEHFGRSPNVVGQTMVLNDTAYEIVGVMPADFSHRGAALFVPLAASPRANPRASRALTTYGRLRPDVSIDQALTEMRAINQQLVKEFGGDHGIDVASYQDVVVGGVRSELRLLLGVVIALLAIGCVNVANLLLAGGLARRHEFGVRLALGARVSHLARQLAAEGVVLAGIGGLAGIAIAVGLLRVFIAMAGDQLPRATSIAIDRPLLVFTGGLTVVVGIICGLWPLLRLGTRTLAASVRSGDTRTVSGASKQLGGGLVVAEIAMAFALLAGGGLLLKNLLLLQARDIGVQPRGLLAFDLAPSGARYGSTQAVRHLYDDLRSRFRQMSGVERVGTISHLPMRRSGFNGPMEREGGPLPKGVNPAVEFRWYSGDYFEAMGIPLIRGRTLDARDFGRATTAVINQTMADRFWPGEDPIGKQFGQGPDKRAWWEVVGVVGNVRSAGVANDVTSEFYQPLERGGPAAHTVVFRVSTGSPMTLLPSARAIVDDVDPSLAVTRVQTMDEIVAASIGPQRLVSRITGVFAGLAALLAMLGVFGVVTHNLRLQRREFGIRLALGSEAGALRRLILIRALRLALLGTGVGAVVAWQLSGTMQALLNDVRPTDSSVFIGTAIVVIAATLAATWWPACLAGRTDPAIVLRDS